MLNYKIIRNKTTDSIVSFNDDNNVTKVHKPSLNPVAEKSSCHSAGTSYSSKPEPSSCGAIRKSWYFSDRRDMVSSSPATAGTATR